MHFKDKLTSTPFLSEAKSNNQTTLKVPSVKFQGSAFVSTVTATPPVATPILVSTASMNPAAQPFVPRNLPMKEEDHREEYGTPTDTKPSCNNKEECMYTFERNPSCVESGRPNQDYLDIQRKQAELSQMIVTQQARSLLPSHEPPTFSGDVMSYPAFIVAFDTLIESKVDSIKILVSAFIFWISTPVGRQRNWQRAVYRWRVETRSKTRRLFKKHFGDPYKIASAYIAKLTSWPAVRPNDGTALQEFSIALEQPRNAMSGMQYMNDLNTANVLCQLGEKLPWYLPDKWTEKVSKIRSTKQQIASFNHFSPFVSQQADLATDPVYSEEGNSRAMNTVDKYHKQNERKPKRRRRISQQIYRRKRPLEETLFPSAVPCAQRYTTWMNVLIFFKKNPGREKRLHQLEGIMLRLLQFWTHCQALQK